MFLRRISYLHSIEALKCLTGQKAAVFPKTASEVRSFSQEASHPKSNIPSVDQSKDNVSKAMRAYLERAREHDQFMEKEREEFQIGKRHLANMMGENPETFTQEDINNAIEYLFPSGIFEKKARPYMKPPEEVFPQRKAAEFDETGRPYHFLFYTSKPNFYQTLHNIVQHINDLIKFEDAMIRKGIKPDPNLDIELSGYKVLDKKTFETKLIETIGDKDYALFINAFERLCQMPYSYRVKDFIFEYMSPLINLASTLEIPKLKYDAEGRAYITIYECTRKRAIGDVTIRMPGTGKVTINGENITYFEEVQPREQIYYKEQPTHTGHDCDQIPAQCERKTWLIYQALFLANIYQNTADRAIYCKQKMKA